MSLTEVNQEEIKKRRPFLDETINALALLPSLTDVLPSETRTSIKNLVRFWFFRITYLLYNTPYHVTLTKTRQPIFCCCRPQTVHKMRPHSY